MKPEYEIDHDSQKDTLKLNKQEVSAVASNDGLCAAPDSGAIAMATACCGYMPGLSETYPVYWNPYSRVVQCHNCGTVWKPENT